MRHTYGNLFHNIAVLEEKAYLPSCELNTEEMKPIQLCGPSMIGFSRISLNWELKNGTCLKTNHKKCHNVTIEKSVLLPAFQKDVLSC